MIHGQKSILQKNTGTITIKFTEKNYEVFTIPNEMDD